MFGGCRMKMLVDVLKLCCLLTRKPVSFHLDPHTTPTPFAIISEFILKLVQIVIEKIDSKVEFY